LQVKSPHSGEGAALASFAVPVDKKVKVVLLPMQGIVPPEHVGSTPPSMFFQYKGYF